MDVATISLQYARLTTSPPVMNGFEKFYICALATLAVGNPKGACSLKVCCLRTARVAKAQT